MAKLARVTQKIFAGNAQPTDTAVFGTMKTQAPQYTGDIAQLMSNPAFLQGWGSAVEENFAPFMEEMTGVQKVFSQQIAYLLQDGIPEYDPGTTYYIGSVVRSGNSWYESIVDNNTGSAVTDTSKWVLLFNGENFIEGIPNWYNGTIYAQGSITKTLTEGNVILWLSLQDNNLNQNPTSTSGYWKKIIDTSFEFVTQQYVDTNFRRIAYDEDRNVGNISGNYTLALENTDERISIPVADNVTITLNSSGLTFPDDKDWYTVVILIYFTAGAKTVTFADSTGEALKWINGLVPDFTNGLSHLVTFTRYKTWNYFVSSDAGSIGG